MSLDRARFRDMGYAIGNWMVKVPVMPFWAWPGTGHR